MKREKARGARNRRGFVTCGPSHLPFPSHVRLPRRTHRSCAPTRTEGQGAGHLLGRRAHPALSPAPWRPHPPGRRGNGQGEAPHSGCRRVYRSPGRRAQPAAAARSRPLPGPQPPRSSPRVPGRPAPAQRPVRARRASRGRCRAACVASGCYPTTGYGRRGGRPAPARRVRGPGRRGPALAAPRRTPRGTGPGRRRGGAGPDAERVGAGAEQVRRGPACACGRGSPGAAAGASCGFSFRCLFSGACVPGAARDCSPFAPRGPVSLVSPRGFLSQPPTPAGSGAPGPRLSLSPRLRGPPESRALCRRPPPVVWRGG